MTLDEIKQAIAQLSPDERASLRAWLTQIDAGSSDLRENAQGGEATASKLGRLAGRAVADLRKRLRDT